MVMFSTLTPGTRTMLGLRVRWLQEQEGTGLVRVGAGGAEPTSPVSSNPVFLVAVPRVPHLPESLRPQHHGSTRPGRGAESPGPGPATWPGGRRACSSNPGGAPPQCAQLPPLSHPHSCPHLPEDDLVQLQLRQGD